MIELSVLPGEIKKLTDLKKKTIALDGVIKGIYLNHQNKI